MGVRIDSVRSLKIYTNLLWSHAQTGDFDGDGDLDVIFDNHNYH